MSDNIVDQPGSHEPTEYDKTPRKAAASGWMGSALEYYDFFIYAQASALIFPDIFFAKGDPQMASQEHAVRVGADRALAPGPRVVESLAEAHGSRVIRPRLTRIPVLEQGVDVVFDCVALPQSLDLGMHLLRPPACWCWSAAPGSSRWTGLWCGTASSPCRAPSTRARSPSWVGGRPCHRSWSGSASRPIRSTAC